MESTTPTPMQSREQLQGSTVEYKKPKCWKELTADEKIERMREEVKSVRQSTASNWSNFEWLRSLFFKHTHIDGKIHTPTDMYNPNGGIYGGVLNNDASSEDVYF